MNKFKNIFRKIPKTIWILAGLVVVLRIAIEIPVFPYSFNFLSPRLENNKILYFEYGDKPDLWRGSVHLRVYNGWSMKDTKIYQIQEERLLDGLIFHDSALFITGETERGNSNIHISLYEYKKDNLKKIKAITDPNIVFGTSPINLIKIDDSTIGIMYSYYNWNLERSSYRLSVKVRMVDLDNPSEKRELTVGNDYNYDTFYGGIPFINANTYKVAKIDDSKILFKESYPQPRHNQEKFFDNCLMGGYMGASFLCNGYYLNEISLIDQYDDEHILDKSVDFMILDKGKQLFFGLRMSANKDFVIYNTGEKPDNSGDMYILSTSTGRKKLIEKNATPLYME